MIAFPYFPSPAHDFAKQYQGLIVFPASSMYWALPMAKHWIIHRCSTTCIALILPWISNRAEKLQVSRNLATSMVGEEVNYMQKGLAWTYTLNPSSASASSAIKIKHQNSQLLPIPCQQFKVDCEVLGQGPVCTIDTKGTTETNIYILRHPLVGVCFSSLIQ